MKSQLTAVILSLNEEERIGKCVESLVGVADRLVVMDSFSTDSTLNVVKNKWVVEGKNDPSTLVCVLRSWQGFTKSRNLSLEWVNTPWVLWIDSDEWLDEKLRKELLNLESIAQDKGVFRLKRKNFFLGKFIRFGGWYPDRKSRLGRTLLCEWKTGPKGADVHEDLYPKGFYGKDSAKESLFSGNLCHVTFRDTREQKETNERYSTLIAEGVYRQIKLGKAKEPSDFMLCCKPLIKFIENYFWKLGILDGVPGYLIARGSAQSLRWRLEKIKKLVAENA